MNRMVAVTIDKQHTCAHTQHVVAQSQIQRLLTRFSALLGDMIVNYLQRLVDRKRSNRWTSTADAKLAILPSTRTSETPRWENHRFRNRKGKGTH